MKKTGDALGIKPRASKGAVAGSVPRRPYLCCVPEDHEGLTEDLEAVGEFVLAAKAREQFRLWPAEVSWWSK